MDYSQSTWLIYCDWVRRNLFFSEIPAGNHLPAFFSLSPLLLYRIIPTMSENNDHILIRPVQIRDKQYTPEACKMINAAFRSSESWTTDRAVVGIDRIDEKGVDEIIENSGKADVLLYALDGEAIVGCVLIKQDGLLSMLAVSPRYQSRGIGGLLIKKTIEYMKTILVMKMAMVHVFLCKPELLTWYQRIGFEDDGEVIPFPDKSVLIVDEAPLAVLKYRIF
jgi:GNAT superfamily N-acetyltransferase